MTKKILVTGGAGFIGTNLCERLLEQGHQVLCLDNFYSGTEHNINHLIEHPNFSKLYHDICEPMQVETDEIYHLACPASPKQYQRDSVKTIQTCIQGTLNVLELARETRAKLFFSSTSEVYGVPNVHPQSEAYWGNVNPIGIRSCYDEGKRCAESLILNFHRQYHVDVSMLRIFNCYGPRLHVDDGRVVSNFICAALLNRDIKIFGDGQQTRCFCYIDDIVDGILQIMKVDDPMPYNIGSTFEVSVLELAHKVIELTDSKSNIIFKEKNQDDPRHRMPDTSRIRARLNWESKMSLDDGLKKTITYFRQQLTK